MAPRSGPVREEFERRYIPEPNSGCWLWLGPLNSFNNGYGQFTHRPSRIVTMRAHRVSWKIYKGEIPKGMNVLHQCDNTLCVNPDHLFIGTQSDNIQDAVRKGRHKTPFARL